MIPTNIVTVTFGTLFSRSRSAVAARSLHQWDYGQVLQLFGIDLPELYSVHFSNLPLGGEAIVEVGNADGVPIPDALLETGLPVYAWVYLHTGDSDGETAYSVTIPVIKRSQPTDGGHDPADVDSIDRAITALNGAVEAAETAQRGAETAQQAAEEAAEGAQTAVSGAVRFDGDQDLREDERKQARNNLAAASLQQLSALSGTNSVKLCDSTQPANNTDCGITFTWTGNFKCAVTGTASGNAISRSCVKANPLPTDEVKAGGTYFVYFKSTGTKCRVQASWYIDNPGGFPRAGSQLLTKSQMFTVPAAAISFFLEAYVPSGSGAVNETVNIGLYNAPTNLALWEAIQALS